MEARLARVQERLNLATEKNERMEEEQRNAVAELSRTGSNLAELDDARKESEILAAQIDSLIADKKELKDEKDRFEDLSNEQATEIEALKLQVASSSVACLFIKSSQWSFSSVSSFECTPECTPCRP